MPNHVEFYMKAVEDKKATKAEGRPIYRDVPYVRIRFPGDKHRIHEAPAHDKTVRDRQSNSWLDYTQQYPEHWELFQRGNSQQVIGTPLSELPFLTEAKRAEFRAMSIHTAEMLAGLADRDIARLGPWMRGFVNQARDYLGRAASVSDTAKLRAEIETLREQIASMAPPDAEPAPTHGGADFDQWAPEDIKAFLADMSVEVDGRWGKDRLVREANAVVAAKQKAA